MNKDEDFEREPAIRALAKEQVEVEGELEIDDDAVVSEGDDNGAYVQAWVWVRFDGTKLDKEALCPYATGERLCGLKEGHKGDHSLEAK